MKLRKIQTKNIRSSKPFLSFNPIGVMTFSTNAIRTIVQENSHINFYQDEENSENWYIHFASDGLGIRKYKHQCLLNSKSIYLKIAESTRQDPESNFRAYLGKPFTHSGKEFIPLLIQTGSHRY